METPPVSKHKPSYTFEGGHFYCDGVRVSPKQMTEKEIRLYIPKEFQPGFLAKIGIKQEERNGKVGQ